MEADGAGTAPPRQRLRALERLAAAGVRVGVGMAPLLPGLSDRPQQLAAVVRSARDAGASHVWANVLHLQPGTREHFLEQLGRDWPEERARYEAMYGPRGYVAASVAEPVLERVARLRERYGVGGRGRGSRRRRGRGRVERLCLDSWRCSGRCRAPRRRPAGPGRGGSAALRPGGCRLGGPSAHPKGASPP
ncbi:MAG: hypothetical protein R3B59_09085 [Dehalococcoidia bacterium]